MEMQTRKEGIFQV